MKKHRRLIGAITIVTAWVSACEGPAGSQGPAGPSGTGGRDGTNGADGVDGLDGSDGMDGVPIPPRLVDERLGGWAPGNADRLNDLLVTHGIASATWDGGRRPVAIFDWDNTVLKNDIGDATFFWMLRNDVILQPAGRDWRTTNANLTDAAVAALNLACDGLANPGQPLPTRSAAGTACANEILNVYFNARTVAGSAAWQSEITLTINQPYAWVAQLQAGWSPSDIREFARAAYEENAYAPVGATQTVGSTSVTGYVRIYDQIRDLIGALHDNGFDVWILTASPQFVVEPVAELVGVPRDRVIGIRTVVSGGFTTADLEECGTAADNTLITFDEGKRCWINKVIFGQPVASQLATASDPERRPVFVAGDSDTDIAMLKDATALKLAINRNKTQIMCNAYNDYMGRWIVQPMFIAPRACRTTPFPCSTATDAAGALIRDEAGALIADQTDSVCTLP